MRRIQILFLLLSIGTGALAQTGPGGVGNPDGTGSQPINILWLDAASLSLSDGDNLTSWIDLSGNGNDLSQATTTLTPFFMDNATDNLNGNPIIRFSQDNNRILKKPFNDFPTSGITTIIVFKTSETNNNAVISYAEEVEFDYNEYLIWNTNSLTVWVEDVDRNTGVDLTTSGWEIMVNKWESSSGALSINMNGDQDYSTTNFRQGITLNPGGSFVIGGEQDDLDGGYDSDQDFDGDIAEIIMFSSSINTAQTRIIENYLSAKYNLSLDNATNDKYSGNDASFIVDVAGIGQESDGDHSQTQSGGLYLYERNTTLANTEYVMLGHDGTTNNSSTTYTGANLPSGTEASWARDWYIEKSGTVDVKLIFDFKEALSDGAYPSNVTNYVLLRSATSGGAYSKVAVVDQGINDADQVYFDVSNTNLTDGYYTIGTDDQTNSPIEGVESRTWYALTSGDWDTWDYWTLDPSGALPNNPGQEIPGKTDNVVIHTGKTITVGSDNDTVGSILVEGILDLGSTVGHDFNEIRGNGRIRISNDNFPDGDATHFITAGQGEGTVVFQGGTYTLNSAQTYFDVEIQLDAATNSVTLLENFTVNGDLLINVGDFIINTTSTDVITLDVTGDVTVESNGEIAVGTGNTYGTHSLYHQFVIGGDFTNNGNVEFTNRGAADYYNYDASGAVEVIFNNSSENQTIQCNGPTIFNQLTCNKGSDATYILEVTASSTANFSIYGRNNQEVTGDADGGDRDGNKALRLLAGTLKLGSNIVIPSINEGWYSYDIDSDACLWLDNNASVTSNGDWGSYIAVYGELRFSGSSQFTDTSDEGIIIRKQGTVKVEGGTHNVEALTTSAWGTPGDQIGAYIQTGGIFYVNDERSNEYAPFHLPYTNNIFQMTGGTIHVKDQADGGAADDFAFIVNSQEGNYNVTGGTVILDNDYNNTAPYRIVSRAPIWNLILRDGVGAGNEFLIDELTGTTDSEDISPALPLVVLNDLTVEGTNSPTFTTNNYNVSIGGDFTIGSGATYNHGTNTTVFDTEKESNLYISALQTFNNLTISKTVDDKNFIIASAPATAIQVDGELRVEKGTFDYNTYEVDLNGALYIADSIGTESSSGSILFSGTAQQTVTSVNGVIQNMEIDNSASEDNVSLDGNLNIFGTLTLTNGVFDINTDKLTMFGANASITGSFGAGEMIQTNGNASDGGLEMYLDGNEVITFPLGTDAQHQGARSARYTPAVATFTSYNDDGYVRISVADDQIPMTIGNGGDIIYYYWKIRHSDFTTLPNVSSYVFTYDESDATDGENGLRSGKVLDVDPFTQSTENGHDRNANTITFNAGFDVEFASYTAGNPSRFNGAPDVYYTRYTSGQRDWNTATNWEKVSVGSGDYEVPVEGSIVVIRESCFMNISSASINNPGVVTFDQSLATPNTEQLGRIQFHSAGTYDLGVVSGTGMISFDAPDAPDVSGDFGDFGSQEYSFYMYFGGNATLNSIPEPIPNLMVEAATYQIDQNIEINENIVVQGNGIVIPLQDIEIGGDIVIGSWVGGTFQFPSQATPINIHVGGNIDFTVDPYLNPQDRNLIVEAAGVENVEHSLILEGDILHGAGNGYDIDLWESNTTERAILEISGQSNNTYSRTSTSEPELYRLIINKGIDQTYSYSFDESFTLRGATSGPGVDKALELQNGTLVLNDADIDINLTTGDDDFDIPLTSSLEVKQGEVNVSGDDSGIKLYGKLLVSGGTVDMDDLNYPATANGNNYIEYSGSGDAQLKITSGTLTVGSQIRRSTTTTTGILRYTQSGGTVSVGVNDAPEGSRGVLEILNTGSLFRHKGGNLNISNGQTGATIASLYLNPDTVDIATGTTINLGDGNTETNQQIGIYSLATLENISVNNASGNSPKAKMLTIPLTLNGSLTINNGTSFNANSYDLNLYGDFINGGSFIPNQNNTYFKGASDQLITGNTTFYNLINQNSANLNLTAGSSDIVINDFTNELGSTINDNSNEIYVEGNVDMSGTHVYGGSGDGVTLNGNSKQQLTGDGSFGKLTINNPFDIEVPVGNALTVTSYLKLVSGVLDIGSNLLTLNANCVIQEANPFNANNMIQTNVSFTDNGVKKYFPSGVYNFTYPIGSGGKYTPVEISATQNTETGAYLIAKGADEYHPSIVNDSEGSDPAITDTLNVLQYYWVLTANGFTDLNATIEMEYDTSDVEVTAPYDVYDYVTAKLLNDGSGNWLKFDDVSKFDETNTKLIFDIDSDAHDIDITGDYTAGVDGSTFSGAIPDNVPLYQSNGTGVTLDWHTASTWRVDDGTGTWVLPATEGLPDIPKGARVRILTGDIVQTSANYISAYTLRLNGTIDVGTTFGNRVGVVSGQGTLYTERGTLPAGYYESFFSDTGGTVEFGGSTDYSVLSNISQVRHVTFSGTGLRELPNLQLTVLGNMLFSDAGASAADVVNEFDQDLLIGGNVTFNAGTFDAGIGTSLVIMNGTTAQSIDGSQGFTGSDAFWNFELDNSSGLTLNTPIDIDQDLTLTNGLMVTTSTNIVSVTNTGATITSSSTDYVDGPMRKNIATADDFTFPIGDASRYGEFELQSTQTTGSGYWEVEYYNSDPSDHTPVLDTASRESGLEMVSGNEYWRVYNAATDSSRVNIRWDDQSLLPAMTSDRVNNLKIVEWSGTQWEVVDGTVTDGGVNSGSILSTHRPVISTKYFTLGTYESTPLPTATFTSNDTTICAGQSVTLSIDLTGDPNWDVTIEEGGHSHTFAPQATSPLTFSVDSAGTYTITAVSDNIGAGTPFGPNVTVIIVAAPTAFNITPGVAQSYCVGGSGVAVGLDGSEIGVNYELLADGVPTGSTVAGDGGAITFGNQTNAGTVNYTVEATSISAGCTATMTGSVNITANPLPTATLSIVNDTICSGDNIQIDLDFTTASTDWDLVIDDGTNPVENINGVTNDPYSYIPAVAPVWVNDGSPDTDYVYSIQITDSNSCVNTYNSATITVFKVPETGPQYHIPNTYGN